MALDKNDLLSLIATNLPDNTVGAITPALLRQVVEQITSSNANLSETIAQTFTGDIAFQNQGTIGYTSIASFVDTTTQVGVTDVASTIKFGGGGTSGDGHVTVGADGSITINTDSYLSLKQRFRAGRTGASGVSQIFFWAEVSTDGGTTWTVIGNSVGMPLNSSEDSSLFFDISSLYLTAGTKLRNRFARSSTGDDSGDLRPATPSAALTTLGVTVAPSAQITVYRIDQ